MAARERGSGTVLAAAVVLLVATVAGLLVLVAIGVAAAHAVRAAADLAALSGAAAHARGQAACPAARVVAAANGSRLVACAVTGDSLDFVVSVTVAKAVGGRWPGLPGEVAATAHAGRTGPGRQLR